jgi:hypothetical protein
VTGFGAIADALHESVRTSMSTGEFTALMDHLGDGSSIGESIGLVPPLVEPGRPDYDRIRAIVDAVERYVATGEPSGYAT